MPNNKTCFVISPIGSADSDIRKYADKVLRFVIKHSLEPIGYHVTRADEISEPGTINLQVIKRIIESDLVVTDLTGTNPNVMYELAIRHAVRKPSILIARIGEKLPFDIVSERTVLFDINDIESVEGTRKEIVKQTEFIESNSYKGDTPFSIATDMVLSASSENPLNEVLIKLTEDLSYLKNTIKSFVDESKLSNKIETRKPIGDQGSFSTEEKWIKIYLEFPTVGGIKEVGLEISSRQSLADTFDEIWYLLVRDKESNFHPDPYTYLWDWVLVRKEDGIPLVVKRVMQRIRPQDIFSDNELWQIIKLDKPLLNNAERFGINKGESDRG
jgi:hypothetical protein